MRFDPPLTHGTLQRRYKRFLADIELRTGEVITAHCPDPGAMRDLATPGREVALSRSDDKKRKLAWTWELVRVDDTWVTVHPGRTNAVVEESLRSGGVPELRCDALQREVRVGDSRLDFRLERDGVPCYLEVKTVTLAGDSSRALFPDSVTTRGQRHLRTLIGLAAASHRAALLFVVGREDCESFGPADGVDRVYGRLLREAAQKGVEILAYRAHVSPKQVALARSIPTIW